MLVLTLPVTAPLSVNPPAPAQGALALEVTQTGSKNDLEALAQIQKMIQPILDPIATADVRAERAKLARHGGGCHQKIGVSVVSTNYGKIGTVRGITQSGQILDSRQLTHTPPDPHTSATPVAAWSTSLLGITLFDREQLSTPDIQNLHGWYVSHPDALPNTAHQTTPGTPKIWCSGLMTWKQLASRGLWVEGCDDSLGESDHDGFTKLAHSGSPELGAGIATYRLVPRPVRDARTEWKIAGKTHFYWKSISQFNRVSEMCPEIIKPGQIRHACGMGATARALSERIPDLEVCLDEADWRRRHAINN
jgi:hydroxymethylbilane synthase